MQLDTSVAPEIALAGPDAAAQPAGTAPAPAVPATIGYLARCLRLLAADPQAWWDLVRFDPGRPVQVAVPPPGPGCETWLLVLPPGHHGEEQQAGPGWEVACLIAGTIAGPAGPPGERRIRPLLPGRLRVRGGREPHHLINTGSGYAVSLHARSAPAAPPPGPGPAQRPPRPARTRAG